MKILFKSQWLINKSNVLNDEMRLEILKNENLILYPGHSSPAADVLIKITIFEEAVDENGEVVAPDKDGNFDYYEIQEIILLQMKLYTNSIPKYITDKFKSNIKRIIKLIPNKLKVPLDNVSIIFVSSVDDPISKINELHSVNFYFIGKDQIKELTHLKLFS